MMDIFNKIVGGVMLIFTSICGIVFCYYILCAITKKAFEKLIWRIEESERSRIAQRMFRHAWWFSESPEAMEAINICAKALIEDNNDISTLRSNWRDKFKMKDKVMGE